MTQRIRYLSAFVVMLMCVAARGQDFHPDYPAEPSQPIVYHTLTVVSAGGGTVTGGGRYAEGSTQSVKATAATDYAFTCWTNEAGDTISSAATFSYTIGTSDATLTAHFKGTFNPTKPGEPDEPAITPPTPPIVYYNLTVSATDGGTASGGGSYEAGTQVTVKATSATEYAFTCWTNAEGDTVSTSASYVYTMAESDETLIAHFKGTFNPLKPNEPDEPAITPPVVYYLLTVNAETGGSATGGGSYEAGTLVTVKATASTDYAFTCWTNTAGDTVSTAASYNYTMTQKEETLTAHFRESFSPSKPNEPSEPAVSRHSFYLSTVPAKQGDAVDCPVFISTMDVVTDIRFQLTLPSGVTPDFSAMTLSDKATGYTVAYEQKGDTIFAITLTGGTLPAGTTKLVSLPIQIPSDYALGKNYPLYINQVSVSLNDSTTTSATTRNGHLEVYLQGDVNGSGIIDLQDLVVVRLYLDGQSFDNFVPVAADVNRDGIVDEADVDIMKQMLLDDPAINTATVVVGEDDFYSLPPAPMHLKVGEIGDLAVQLDYSVEGNGLIEAFICDVTIPSCLQFAISDTKTVGSKYSDYYDVAFKQLSDSVMRVSFSPSKYFFFQNDTALTIPVKAVKLTSSEQYVKVANSVVVLGNERTVRSTATFSAPVSTYDEYAVTLISQQGGTATGGRIVRSGEDITIHATPYAGYHFEAWICKGDTVSTDTLYQFVPSASIELTAHFMPNIHTVHYIGLGNELHVDTLSYGSPITPPTDASVIGHTFNGWNDVPASMPDNDLVITGTFTPNRYTLLYIIDGETVGTDSVTYATEPTPREEPTKEGYTFSGWSEIPATMPAHDVTVNGSFIIKKYLLTYQVDDETIHSDSIAYATTLTPFDAPKKEGHTFNGWSEIPATMPAHDVTIVGTYSVNTYIVRYFVDGVPYDSTYVAYGQPISLIDEPTQEGMTFSGWIGAPATMPAQDVNIAGTFSTDRFLISFIADGDTIQTDSITFGYPIVAPTPKREGYTFSGWSEIPPTMPAHDVNVSGSFVINKYLLTYQVDNVTIQSDSVTFATTLTPREEPTKEGYTFSGWTEIPDSMPAHDVNVSGSFVINKYLLTYQVDNVTVQSDSVTFATKLTPREEPTKEGYTFSGWSNIPATMPAHDVTVSGSFTINKYLLTYQVDNVTVQSDSVTFATKLTPREEPTKEGYTFSGWSKIPDTMPAHDVNVSGSFVINKYLLTYQVDGVTVQSDSVTFATKLTPLKEPTKEGYTFSGWTEIPATMPAHDVNVSGSFVINKYLLTYQVDGVTVQSDSVTYATTLTPRVEPTKKGYTFSGWSEIPATMPAHDVTVSGSFVLDTFETDSISFKVTSQTGEETVTYTKGPATEQITIPSSVTYDGQTYPVTAVADSAFAGQSQLKSVKIPSSVKSAGKDLFAGCSHVAAITWEAPMKMTQEMAGTVVNNPNLLFYTTDVSYAPDGVTNVINSQTKQAEQIVLTDDGMDNDFYCPEEFTADEITYIHHYQQTTVTGQCQGWESLVLPFDVTEITHETKGVITPFGALPIGHEFDNGMKPFWLYEYTTGGRFAEADGIKANVPYILSMPNEAKYPDEYILAGFITFKCTNATVKATSGAKTVKSGNYSFTPNYENAETTDAYLLNVGQSYDGNPEGSVFVKSDLLARQARPFEAYFQLNGSAGVKSFFSIFDELTDGIRSIDPAKRHSDAEYYQLDGTKRSNLQRGFNIVRTPDGKTQKVLAK